MIEQSLHGDAATGNGMAGASEHRQGIAEQRHDIEFGIVIRWRRGADGAVKPAFAHRSDERFGQTFGDRDAQARPAFP